MNLTRIMAGIAPDTKWMSIDDTYENLTMLDGSEKPSLETFEAAEILINAEIEQEKIYNDKWDLVSNYLINEIPNILDNNGNEYIVKNGEIENIRKKFFDWNDTESYNWIQYNIPTFVTHKVQLAVVMQKYNELEQQKINEIFELGEV